MFLRECALFAALTAVPVVATATTVDLVDPGVRVIELEKNADWTKFRFTETSRNGAWLDADASGRDANGNPDPDSLQTLMFVVDLQEAAMLQVTDAWLYGDQFEVTWGDETRMTSVVDSLNITVERSGNPLYDIRDDYTAAFENPKWSSGSWLLGPGYYEVTGRADSVVMVGSGAIRVVDVDVAPVPIPASMALLLTAGAAMGGLSLRRRRKS